MSNYVAVLVFPGEADAFKALSDLGASSVGTSVKGAAIVERAEDGTVTVPQAASADLGAGFATGGFAGLLVGVLGGPLGMLLGWGLGATTGGIVDASRADEKEAVLLELSKAIRPSSNALVLETEEQDLAALDNFAKDRNAEIVRRNYDDVKAEVEAQEAALEAAQKAAKEELKAQKKAAKNS